MTTKALLMSKRTGLITVVGSVRDAGKVGDLSALWLGLPGRVLDVTDTAAMAAPLMSELHRRMHDCPANHPWRRRVRWAHWPPATSPTGLARRESPRVHRRAFAAASARCLRVRMQ
ncbi:hypothetical protein [Pseudomonas panipatensis]|uniref:hypothetical protein n=1 Tax=Pseudomonas panipatensis TaxID=428992 RepID=UPI000B7F7E8D|nr:hypothetical protein [Pseudomonas panipatensis]